MSTETTAKPSRSTSQAESSQSRYVIHRGVLCQVKFCKSGLEYHPLTNFSARIIRQRIIDDGLVKWREYEIVAQVSGRHVPAFSCSPDEFRDLGWVGEHLGAEAIIWPINLAEKHVLAAVQAVSGVVPETPVYGHTGWREINGKRIFLHGGGAIGPDTPPLTPKWAEDRAAPKAVNEPALETPGPIGPNGPVSLDSTIRVELPADLSNFTLSPRLHASFHGMDLRSAIGCSLFYLDLLPPRLSYLLFAAPWTAALGLTDFGIFINGTTGKKKTCLAALLQQFFAPGATYKNPIGSWEHTSTYIGTLTGIVKDHVLHIDEFVPEGTQGDVSQLHKRMARLARASANRNQRGRCRGDGSLAPSHRPGALIVYTGEDLPRGRSVQARLLILELGKGTNANEPLATVDEGLLTRCQNEAEGGVYAYAMREYIRWLCPQWSELTVDIEERLRQLRMCLNDPNQHPQTRDILCKLAIGFETFLHFALSVGAIQEEQHDALWDTFAKAVCYSEKAQGLLQTAEDPIQHVFELLSSLLTTKHAHVAGFDGKAPEDHPEACGWESFTKVVGEGEEAEDKTVWQHRGPRIGWYDGQNLMLSPKVSIAAAEKLARDLNQTVAVSERTLGRLLDERGLLLSHDKEQGHYAKRCRFIDGRPRVLHIPGHLVINPPTKEDYPDPRDLLGLINA